MTASRVWLFSPLLVGLLVAPGARAETEELAPACAETCKAMLASGEMRKDLNEAGCVVKVCHDQARRYYERFKFDLAMASLDQIDDVAAFQHSYQLDRGLVNYARGDFDKAIQNFEKVLEARPESIHGAAQRAHTLVRLRRMPEARAQFEQILGFPGADSTFKGLKLKSYVQGNLAVLRLMEEDLAGGRRQLKKALKVDPRNKLAHTFLEQIVPALDDGTLDYGSVYRLVAAFEEISLHRANAGLRELSSVLNRSPEFPLAYLLAAKTQRRYLDFKGCEMTLRMAEQRFPDNTEVFANRIRCTMMRYGIHAPQSIQSVEQLKALAAKDPDHPLVQEILLLISQ